MSSDALPLILIVDDESANLQILVEALRNDYRIKAATNGHDALKLANKNESPDLVILDVQMPEMDGFQVCRKLKENPRTQHIPVMFVTAMSSASAEFEGLQLEAMEYINKPVNPSTLRMRVRNLVRLKLMQDQLLHLSTHDALTELANRRRFDEFLGLEWRRAHRFERPIGLIMFDIDHFKKFNDHYGHPQGDSCLKQVAAVLASVTNRPDDLAARYGGEEFAVILSCTQMDDALNIAEQCREQIEALQIPHELSSFGIVTVSCGVEVMVPSNAHSALDFIRQADKKLYLAKNAGRNQVVS